ncbi:hypothetical protein MVEG_09476 [Podila verticillata NRRL 6337]|nr:hypothetical protein MVEG_09476 [Podila verticillata NRRL 6337]
MVSIISWESPIESCEFLASDDTTIALKIKDQIALFAAATGTLLRIYPVPLLPTNASSLISLRWLFPTDVESLVRLFEADASSSFLAKSRCLVPDHSASDADYGIHHSGRAGSPTITRRNGAILDFHYLEDVALQLDGSSLPELHRESNSDHLLKCLEYLMRVRFPEEDTGFQSLAIQYLNAYVNSNSGDGSNSVMTMLCKQLFYITPDDFTEYRPVLKELLEYDNWIPRSNYTRSANPLNQILFGAQDRPQLTYSVKDMIEWCLGQAKIKSRQESLYFILHCMPELVQSHPEMALKVIQHFAHIQAHNRKFIIKNQAIIGPPSISRRWNTQGNPLKSRRNQILQIYHEGPYSLFSEKIFVAPFDLLWSVEKPPEDHNLSYVRTNLQPMAWRRVLLHLFLRQITPFQKSPTYVYPHYYKLNMLNNPAIEALIQYKWHQFTYILWLARFSLLLCYYSLIVFAASMQIYSDEPDSLFYVFIFITVISFWFVILEGVSWLELRKARNCATYKAIDPKRLSYLRSFYNILDLLAFLIPMGASINQLINISQMDSRESTLNLSFSIIIIFLHMLSELRVIQHVCKYVTIIIRVIVEIRVFFMVFALGILSFSLAIQHVIQGCPSKGGGDSNGCRKDLSTDFPYNFVEAISSTYFIMGGRYDSVSKEFSDSPNASLQAMMAIYFFFTVILMLNVLIALINGGFSQADNWRLVWLENRLRYVESESAEEMSYHIPGTWFRQSKNWFPREIYYTRTKAQVAEYEEKVLGKKQSDGYDGGVSSSKEQSDPTELQQLRTQVGDLVKQQVEYNANLEKMFADLIERLGKDK